MTFNWSDYLHLAEELLHRRCEDIKDEALYRCIISRSYYSLLIQLNNLLEAQGEYIEFIHQDILEILNSRSKTNPWVKTIAADLNKLKISRRKADYDNEFQGNIQSDAKNSIKWARKGIENIGAIEIS